MTAPGLAAPTTADGSGSTDTAVSGAVLARAFRLSRTSLALSLVILVVAMAIGVLVGPAGLGLRAVLLELVDRLPFVSVDSGLTDTQQVILCQWRITRVVLGAAVGASRALAGAGYQGVFRNPLADPYLLGVAAGAGLGAALAILTAPPIGAQLRLLGEWREGAKDRLSGVLVEDLGDGSRLPWRIEFRRQGR